MIETSGLTKQFDDILAVDHISAKIRDGSVFGLIGTNGAGKSTFLRMVSGILKPDEGAVLIDGENVYENPAVKSRFFYISDDQYFFANGTPLELMKFYKSIYPAFDEPRFFHLLQSFDLDKKRKISTFSKGMKKQLSIVYGICAGTDYIFCDETFDGLDPVMRSFVKKLICEDVLERGASAIITSHSLRELEDICDQLALLHKGGLVLESDIENLKTSQFKIQIAFREDYDKSKFDGIQISHYEKSGSVANLIVSGEREDIVQKLRAMDPILLDVLPLSLEEVFTYEMETLGYTFQIDDLIEEENRHAES